MRRRRFFAIEKPFVHAPEMRGMKFQAEGVDHARDEGELFRRPNRTTDANGIVGRGLFPSGNIFERFGTIKILQRVVENNFETGARELEKFFRRELGGFSDDVVVERGVIPPIRSDGTEFAGHKF